MKLTHVLVPELPDGAAQMATLLSAGSSSLQMTVSQAVKPVQVTWLLAVFSSSSSVLSVPHSDSVTAGKMAEVKHTHTPVTVSLSFLLSVCSQNLQSGRY